MPSGRAIVDAAWARLPLPIRTGSLGGRRGTLSRRAYKPLMRALLPEMSATALASAVSRFDSAEAELITAAIIDAQEEIVEIDATVTAVLTELAVRGYTGGDDPPFTAAIRECAALLRSGRVPDESDRAALVAGICDPLTAIRSLSVREVKECFSDPETVRWIQGLLDDARQTPSTIAAGDRLVAERRGYLDAVGTRGGRPSVEQVGQDLWRVLVSVDDADAFGSDMAALGLSAHAVPVIPRVGDPAAENPAAADDTAPMDASLYRRVWSVADGAASRPWIGTLPTTRALIAEDAAATARPLQLATSAARAVLAAGLDAYRDVLGDPHALAVDPRGLDPSVMEALSAQRRRLEQELSTASRILTRRIHAFLRGIGDDNALRGWSRLSARAQDALSQPERTLLPRLWRRAHNAQFRHGHLDEAAEAWALIFGQLVTLLADVRSAHRQHPGRSRTVELIRFDHEGYEYVEPDAEQAAQTRLVDYEVHDATQYAMKVHRDERVRETLIELRTGVGWSSLEGFLSAMLSLRTEAGDTPADAQDLAHRRAELQGAWAAAAERISSGASAETGARTVGGALVTGPLDSELAASWTDLMDYLDDHLAI